MLCRCHTTWSGSSAQCAVVAFSICSVAWPILKPMAQLAARLDQEGVAGVSGRHHQMGGQRGLGGAHRPNMQVVDREHAGQAGEIIAHSGGVDGGGNRRERHRGALAQQSPRSPYDDSYDQQAGHRIDPQPSRGHDQDAGHDDAGQTAASAAMCRYAPRMLRSPWRPDANNHAVMPLITMPTAATTITVMLATGSGCSSR